jgi:hypothetical protein
MSATATLNTCESCPYAIDAVQNGHIECLRLTLPDSRFADERITFIASDRGYLDCLKYAILMECGYNRYAMNAAAQGGHIECIKFLHSIGCPWNAEATENAAMEGHLECLKYLHENGCSWDTSTTLYAAHYGHLECLKYAHTNGCGWDGYTTIAAIAKTQIDCLMYALENGCEWKEPRQTIHLRHSLYWVVAKIADKVAEKIIDRTQAKRYLTVLLKRSKNKKSVIKCLENHTKLIDFDDPEIRNILFKEDLREFIMVKTAVQDLQRRLEIYSRIATSLPISADVVKHHLLPYF